MSLSATYISVDSFSVVGNYADYLIADRAVLCDCGVDGIKKRIGVSSSYAAGVTTVTLKTDGTRNLTSNLATIEWSVVKPGSEGNIPLHEHTDDDDGGPPGAHASLHENAGADEISVAGLSGLLADDQHVLDAEVLAVAAALDHASRHENAGADEISVAGLSGLLADDQHVLNAEVLAVAAALDHDSDHITGGSDEMDGDKLDVDWTPTNYTPATTPAEADNVDNLTAHLYGIDQALSAAGLSAAEILVYGV